MTQTLPILERRRDIENAIASHQVVIVCGETGSGKTTQLPQICFEMGLAGEGLIAHTQPRRLAARAVAARIAEERGERLGGLVGVKVRFEDQTGPRTRIKLMTDGMLLAEMGTDARLSAYRVLIIDEAHERSLNIDFLLGYLRTLLPRRPDLKLVITSATIDPGRFSDYFGGPALAPMIEVSGRSYPVDVRYRPTAGDDDEFERIEVEAVADAVDELTGGARGDVLVFLPGEREIRFSADALRRRSIDAEILPLFSRLTNQEQDRIFHPGDRQRVILSTNVAETSLTVPGIRFVVDTGYARTSRYDPQRKIGRLPIEPISRASAEQRSGRCGRVAPGVCIRLYSEESFRARPRFTDPELRRTSLASVILRMHAMGLGAIEEFPFLDPPDPAAVRDGYETLFELGALDSPDRTGTLTPVGRDMGRLPVDPRIARMLLAAQREGVMEPIVVLAAVLSIQDPRQRPMSRQEEADRSQEVFRHPSSDFLTLLRLWDQFGHAADSLSSGPLQSWCREHYLSAARMREWAEMVRQLRGLTEELGPKPGSGTPCQDAIHRALLTGLISNVACREGESGSFEYRGVRGNVVSLFPGSVLFKKSPKWIVAAEIVQTTRLYARTVAKIEPAWIEELAGHMFQRRLSDRHLDTATGEPSAWERVTMSGIVVVPRRRTTLAALDPEAARAIFVREALAEGKWDSPAPFMEHNRRTMGLAARAEAKLRRRGLLATPETIAAWFDRRLPGTVCDPASFEAWRVSAEATDPRVLMLALPDVVKPEAAEALDPSLYPDVLEIGDGPRRVVCPIEYALVPGKEDDGVTATIGLADLPRLTPDRAAWLVPGMLPELVAALIKSLPKGQRAALEARAPLVELSGGCAGVMRFGEGSLAAALSEAVDVLHGVKIDAKAWSLKALPAVLRLRVRVTDESGKELGVDRDVGSLQERLAGRIRRAQAASSRARFERQGLTAWDFGDLPESVPVERGSEPVPAYPALIDRGDSVSLTLVDSLRRAELENQRGVRRLFALACREETEHHLRALPRWDEMVRHYAQLGDAAELRDGLTCVIAERVFLAGQPPVRTRQEFERRSTELWGRLGAASREVGDIAANMLEPRFRVAQRFSGGTPRLWAQSVADIREHAAYLMPRGFLLLVPWERLRRYPRYAEAMRQRLFSLREDGSGVETTALKELAPRWKRFTAWVASAMSAERALPEESQTAPVVAASPKGKSPLPQARRAAPVVNLDAGAWAMRPGNLTGMVEEYRWALEELRVTLFSAERSADATAHLRAIDELWVRSVGG